MRIADVAVVAEMRRLGLLRERFRQSVGGGGGRWEVGAATLRELVAPYEAAVDELKKEVKLKQGEIENLREKIKTATSFDWVSGKSKGKSKRRVSCTTQVQYKSFSKNNISALRASYLESFQCIVMQDPSPSVLLAGPLSPNSCCLT